MIVCIPCWRRPAHLAALLTSIERARGAADHTYVISVDHEAAPEISRVLETWPLSRRIAVIAYQGVHPGHGPAFNVLAAWRLGLAFASPDPVEPIALLEEDLLVADDIFEFWEDALAVYPRVLGVSACLNQNARGMHDRGRWLDSGVWPEQVIYFHTSYQSLAVALRSDFVAEVLEHAVDGYFEDPSGYVARHLPDDGLPASAVSQDGLFHRVLRRDRFQPGRGLLYGVTPRACHVGWYGYNRREGAALDPATWRADADRILTMSADQMNELADPKFRDIARCHLINRRTALKLF